MTVTEGGSAVLQCTVTAANPSAAVTWGSPTFAVLRHTNGRIQLSSIHRNQNGFYTCIAFNGVGSATTKVTSLKVYCKLLTIFLNSSIVSKPYP